MNNFIKQTYKARDFMSYPEIIKQCTFNFFNEILINLKNNKFLILLKVKYINGTILSYHKGVIVNKKSLYNYIDYLNYIMDFKADNYQYEEAFDEIIFHYLPIPLDREYQFIESKWEDLTKENKITKLDTFLFDNYPLPINNIYSSWGTINIHKKEGNKEFMIINGNKYNYIINTFDSKLYSITLINKQNPNKTFITFTDKKCENNYFIRKLNNYTFYCSNHEILLFTKELKTKFLKPLKIRPLTKCKIITIDIETIVKNGIHKPYLYSFYDGINKYSWFSDNAIDLFNTLLQNKYKNYSVYAHNLSKFDIIFLHKDIAKLNKNYKIEILKRDDKYISINISNISNNISISIKDSLNLLNNSLKDLSKQFNIETPKSIEPVFKGNPLSEYYQEDLSHYNKDVNIIYDLDIWKKEIQNYCEIDCIALYQILIKFRELVYNHFQINIDNYPTIPSLAFALFRTRFMNPDTIPIINGNIFEFIHESFTGGSTEMYIPFGENINCYDVNSLYPSSMKFNKYPTGNIIQFQGDINWLYRLDPDYNQDNTYWIGDVKVKTKIDLHKPYLQINHLTKENNLINRRTISPNGSFTMKINSPEYYNALKDYNFEINSGFLFEAEDIFSKYVEDIYSLRKQYHKSDPMNYICKLLMNSLYGRFGMKPILHKTRYIPRDLDIFDFIDNNEIYDYIDIDRDTILISYKSKNENQYEDFKNSIAIASAVTAYSRVFMSLFKNSKLYYTDTDSLFIKEDLDSSLIGKELGQFKLEYKFKEICFLGPKIYAGITTDDQYICKIKGYKNSKDIPYDTMKSLLMKDNSIILNHIKWFRNISQSEIVMKKQVYELIKSQSKREIIYNDKNIAINTKAFKINNNIKLNEIDEI